jgi:hypothetical protein
MADKTPTAEMLAARMWMQQTAKKLWEDMSLNGLRARMPQGKYPPSVFAPKKQEGRQFASEADAQALEADPLSYDVLTMGLGKAGFPVTMAGKKQAFKIADRLTEIAGDNPTQPVRSFLQRFSREAPGRVNPEVLEMLQPEMIRSSTDYADDLLKISGKFNERAAQLGWSESDKVMQAELASILKDAQARAWFNMFGLKPRLYFKRDSVNLLPHEGGHFYQYALNNPTSKYLTSPTRGSEYGAQRLSALSRDTEPLLRLGVIDKRDFPYLSGLTQGRTPPQEEVMGDLFQLQWEKPQIAGKVVPRDTLDVIKRYIDDL